MGAGHLEPEGVGVEEVVVGYPELEGVEGLLHPEVVAGYPEPRGGDAGASSGGEASIPGLRPKIILNNNNYIILCLLLETQFTFFIAPVPAPGYCMRRI